MERDPWARTTIPAHLAKGAGPRLARRPGWARLTSEPAPEFRRVGGARLGTVDVAHWLVCVNGRRRSVRLAYLAMDQRESPLLPWELLSGAEKQGGAKFA